MFFLLALLAAAGLLAAGQAEKRAPAGELPLAELLDAAIEGGLTPAEAAELAAQLDAAGQTALADKLRKAIPAGEPAAPATKREQALAILAVIRDWRDLGADEQACLALDSELVKAVQRAFAIDESGRWTAETAIAAQSVLSDAPAACDLSDLMVDLPDQAAATLPAQWVRP